MVLMKSLEDLADMVSSGLASNEEASGLIARYRGEYPPSGGYVFHHREWIPRSGWRL